MKAFNDLRFIRYTMIMLIFFDFGIAYLRGDLSSFYTPSKDPPVKVEKPVKKKHK